MTQQTAMRQMIDYLEEMKSKTTDQSEIYMLTCAWVKAIHLMEVEKEQMKDIEFQKVLRPFVFDFEQYYNKTYNK